MIKPSENTLPKLLNFAHLLLYCIQNHDRRSQDELARPFENSLMLSFQEDVGDVWGKTEQIRLGESKM
jgi:hypothetical protein